MQDPSRPRLRPRSKLRMPPKRCSRSSSSSRAATVRVCDFRTWRRSRTGLAAAQTTLSDRTDSSTIDSIPGAPSGQGSDEPGSWAAILAVAATPVLKVPATAINAVAAHGSTTTRGTAAVPNRVTGTTKGEATTLATSE